MDKPLEQIVNGKWDVAVAAKRSKLTREIEARLENVDEKKPGEVVKFLDDKFKEDPELENSFAQQKFIFMLRVKDAQTSAVEYGNRLIDKIFTSDKYAQQEIADQILDASGDDKPDAKLLALALKAATNADELAKGKHADIALTLAKTYFASNEAVKALDAMERVMKIVKSADEPDEKEVAELSKLLEKYKKAAEKK